MVGEREGGAEQPAARSGRVFIFPSSLPLSCVRRDKLDTSLGGLPPPRPPHPPRSTVALGHFLSVGKGLFEDKFSCYAELPLGSRGK